MSPDSGRWWLTLARQALHFRVDFTTRQLVDRHADGIYDGLMFDVACGDRLPSRLSMDYSLFFTIDPSHRSIFVMNDAGETSVALPSPMLLRSS